MLLDILIVKVSHFMSKRDQLFFFSLHLLNWSIYQELQKESILGQGMNWTFGIENKEYVYIPYHSLLLSLYLSIYFIA